MIHRAIRLEIRRLLQGRCGNHCQWVPDRLEHFDRLDAICQKEATQTYDTT